MTGGGKKMELWDIFRNVVINFFQFLNIFEDIKKHANKNKINMAIVYKTSIEYNS